MLFRKAILIVHGFAGGTYDQEEFANFLELNRGFDVYQFTLPGHEKNLSKCKYQDWIKASEEHMEWLIKNGYKKIYLIGHSMGGVIAAHLSSKYKEVKKLVLAAPAFHYLNVIDGDKINVVDSLKSIPAVFKTYGSDEVIARLLKLNVSTLKEFMELVKEYYNSPLNVNCPVLILQGKNDNIVPVSSSKYVYDNIKSKTKKIIYFDGVTHDIFRCENKKQLFNIVEDFLKFNMLGGEYNI